jgi:hypothetical protein
MEKTKEAQCKSSTPELIYFISRVETLIEDNKLLKTYVDELRQESSRRKGIQGFMIAVLGILGTVVGWLVDNAIRFMHTGNFS